MTMQGVDIAELRPRRLLNLGLVAWMDTLTPESAERLYLFLQSPEALEAKDEEATARRQAEAQATFGTSIDFEEARRQREAGLAELARRRAEAEG